MCDVLTDEVQGRKLGPSAVAGDPDRPQIQQVLREAAGPRIFRCQPLQHGVQEPQLREAHGACRPRSAAWVKRVLLLLLRVLVVPKTVACSLQRRRAGSDVHSGRCHQMTTNRGWVVSDTCLSVTAEQ